MSGRRKLVAVALAAALLLGAGWMLRRFFFTDPPRALPPETVTGLLAGDAPESFARATAPRPFRFPDDHGPHPDFRHEWWYFTGNLRTADGRRFGYQLTFFRFALAPAGGPPRGSRWAADQAYMAHFSVTDVGGGRFRHFQRAERGALGLAGARSSPFRAWVDDWSAEGGEGSLLPVRLRAAGTGAAVDLLLDTDRPPVPQGDRGLSRKGGAAGNASYYYSFTRLATRGIVRIEGKTYAVEGNSWMDREWGTSALGREHAGWDWFAIQLSDGRDLMFYRIRRRDGAVDPFSNGTLVRPDGSFLPLSPRDVEIEILDHWESPSTGVRYPSRWKVRVVPERIELEVAPRAADQELRTFVRYWEGAVSARGASSGTPVEGEGYVELTGYGEAPGG